jgi:hypothetical protein
MIEEYGALGLERRGEDALAFSYLVHQRACVSSAGHHHEALKVVVAVGTKDAGSAGSRGRDQEAAGSVHVLLKFAGDGAQVAIPISVVIGIASVGG